MFKCPLCERKKLKKTGGWIKPYGKRGKAGRNRGKEFVYKCGNCGYRTIR